MDRHTRYTTSLIKSVESIFTSFLNDHSFEQVNLNHDLSDIYSISIKLSGNIMGECIIGLPHNTLRSITDHLLVKKEENTSTQDPRFDIASEMANMIVGTFVNLIQLYDRSIAVSFPEFIQNKDLTESSKSSSKKITLTFQSIFGFITVALHYTDIQLL